MNNLKVKFGKRLKELRKSCKMTQEELAELVSIEPPNLSKIECGTHFPQPEKIEKIASSLGVSISDLFEFEHLKDKQFLIKEIISNLNDFEPQKVALVHKFVTDIKQYK